ncbi:Transposable element Hobo transposase [Amphibalanus amphitrite]|uniref:Transposable element Hobo transposase n=1 Tax=Amphibalanus amphitrite TaxID=1232801 RepID=A0A6A4W1C7_AMPAM|nr:Transposable element Hobo transposase [Amphibalanus amphitrite]
MDARPGPSGVRKTVFTPSEVKALLACKSDRVTRADPTASAKLKLSVWAEFHVIAIDNVRQDIVQCRTCLTLLRHTSGHDGSGTSGMRQHLASHAKKAAEATKSAGRQLPLTSMLTKSVPEGQLNATKRKLADAIAIATALDMRSIRMCEGEGFATMAQAFLDVGASLGHVKLTKEKLIPSRETVRASLLKTADKLRTSLQEELSRQPSIAITTDHWTDDYTSKSFQSVTAHYITETFDHKNRVMTMKEVKGSHTGDNIRQETEDVIRRQFRFDGHVYVVTDNAANMRKAFRDADWTGCAAHSISLAVKDVLQHGHLKDLLSSAKTAVRVCKKSGVSSELSHTVKQTCPTRWNTELTMLTSLQSVYAELVEVDRPEIQAFLENWTEGLLEDVIAVLKSFGDATQQSEGDGETSQLLAVMWQMALKHLQPDQHDDAFIRHLKADLQQKLEQKLVITDRHLVTTMLVPKYRQLSQFSFVTDRRRDALRRQLVELAAEEVVLSTSATERPTAASSSRRTGPRKRPAVVMLDLDSEDDTDPDDLPEVALEASPRDTSMVYAEAEVARYMENATQKVDNLLEFWKAAKQYPLLQQVARRLLAVPASNAASERVNSIAGRTIEERRTRLTSEMIDSLVFVKFAHDLL